MLDDALGYMSGYVAGNNNRNSYYGSSVLAKSYMHYLLAREGNGRPNNIRKELENTNNVEAKHLLATALFLSGDRSYESMLKNVQPQYNTSRDWRYFSSNDRANGLILALHQELAGRENWSSQFGEPLAKTIAYNLERVKGSYYFSTQELAWMTYGLASRVTESKGWKQPIVKSNGKKKKPVRSNSSSAGWDIYDIARSKQDLTLQSGGSDSYVILSTEGVRENGAYTYGGEGLEISRVYKMPDQKNVDWNNHNLGDEVVVTVTVRNTTSTKLNELALVDHIPSGWEIQNPALGRGNDFTEMYKHDKWESEYTDVQDSEMRVFGDVEGYSTVQFIYSIRATSAGSFFVPPVEIEAMYNHKVWAREAGMNIEVKSDFAKDFL
jgi:alpha-2-macroglobulin